jgi:NAD(P)-dependent dehydrogenase (short-subunit alcohol dehydrogenase family)
MPTHQYLIDLFGLQGKTAVVIGGTGVLCGAMAEGLAMAGAYTIVAGRSRERGQQRVDAILEQGGEARFEAVDVSDRQSIESLCNRCFEENGNVDILVNGPGVNSPTPFLSITDEEWDRLFEVNSTSIFRLCQIFARRIIDEGKKSSFINVSSMSAIRPLSRVFTYSASKAAMSNLSLNLAREWGAQGIRVNMLTPGFFPAEQNRKVLSPERVQTILDHTPMKRFGEAEELIGATLLLASEKAGGFITGHSLVVDGGFACVAI